MELTERTDLRSIHYLNSLTFEQFKPYVHWSSNEAEKKQYYDNLKQYCKSNIKARGVVKRLYAYSLKTPLESGGRLFCGNSIQGVPRDIRGLVMNHTTDIDMKNAHPKILLYLCKKHNIMTPNLAYYCENRDEILAAMGGDKDEKKALFLKSLNYEKLNHKEKNVFFKAFDKEMKSIQKKLCEVADFRDLTLSVPAHKLHNWYGSAINRIMCCYENKILQSAISVINRKDIEIAVLMFDGLMVYGNYYDKPDLLAEIENAVNAVFKGLDMEFSYKAHSTVIQVPENYEPEEEVKEDNSIIANSDLEARDIVLNLIKDDIVCCQGVIYYKKDNRWMDNEKMIISTLIAFVMELNIRKKLEDGKVVGFSNSYPRSKEIINAVLCSVRSKEDNHWIQRGQYSSLGKILFNNGYYNFRTSKFYPIDHEEFDKSIVFMGKIHHDFELFNEEDTEYMKSIAQRLFYNSLGKTVGDYFILNIARGLAGDMMKRIIFALGGTNCGKSVTTTAIKLSFGDYFGSFNAENLAYRNSSNDEAQVMRWAMLLKNKRIIMSNEIKSNVEINGNMIKKISSGGDPIIGRGHGANEEEFIFTPFTISCANDLPKITPYDDAVERRIRVVSYVKQYVDEPSNEFELKLDPEINKEMETLRFQKCFIGLLIEAYADYVDGGRIDEEPAEVIKAKEDWISNDKSVIDTFKNDFEITNNEGDYVSSKDIEAWINSKKVGISMKKFGKELKNYTSIKKLENVFSDGKKIKGKNIQVWFGVKMIEEDCEYDDMAYVPKPQIKAKPVAPVETKETEECESYEDNENDEYLGI